MIDHGCRVGLKTASRFLNCRDSKNFAFRPISSLKTM
jgi:hypothetical protein